MCFNNAAWKREVVPDHKFDFVDVRDYHSDNIAIRLKYIFVYVLVMKSFLVYMSDIYTAATMLSTDTWTNSIFAKCTGPECVVIPFSVGKWIFVGCIIFSFLLLGYEWWKARKIIQSRDISYAFTNVMANGYYSLKSYDHFCFFCQIENSTKKKDDFAFFVFFTFKGWKRLLLADGPRQTINALTLYSFWVANGKGWPTDFQKYTQGSLITGALLISITFTVVVFIVSLAILIVAGICYIPLLIYIQGNLKEYCCHKVDKRIAELLKRKNRQRQAREAALARKEAAGDYSHLKNKKGELVQKPMAQPTLPSIGLDDEEIMAPPRAVNDWSYEHKSDYAGSIAGSAAADYPPMPVYDAYAPHPNQYDHPDYPHYGEDASFYDAQTPQASNAQLGHPAYSQQDLLAPSPALSSNPYSGLEPSLHERQHYDSELGYSNQYTQPTHGDGYPDDGQHGYHGGRAQ